MSSRFFTKRFAVLLVAVLGFSVILSGCGGENSGETRDDMQLKIDQYEEALRYNYTNSYTIETDAFSRVLKEMAECDANSPADVDYLRGKISGLNAGSTYSTYRNTYDLCVKKMQEPRISDEMRELAGEFGGAYWEYLSSLQGLTTERFAQLLKDEEFLSLNEQLQEVTEKYLIIDLSGDVDEQLDLFVQHVDEANGFLSQLQGMVTAEA